MSSQYGGDNALHRLLDKLRAEYGEEALGYALIVSVVVIVGTTIYVVRGIKNMLLSPVGPASHAPKKKKKKGKGPKPTSQGAEGHESEPEEESEEEVEAAPTRTRKFHAGELLHTIKGYQRISCLAVSPCGRYFLVACRKNTKATLFDQQSLARTASPKNVAVPLDRPVITSAGFAKDGNTMAVGDSNTDTFHIFSMSGGIRNDLHMTKLWSYKMPTGQLVSTVQHILPRDPSHLLLFQKNAYCEVIHSVKGNIGKDAIKVGNALCWGMSLPLIAVGGSMMHDCRLGEIDIRGDHNGVKLHRYMSLPTKKLTCCRINVNATRIVTCDVNGLVSVWDVDVRYTVGEDPRIICSFKDEDFKEYTFCDINAKGDIVMLCQGGDAVVYRIVKDSIHSARADFVCDFHDVQPGSIVTNFGLTADGKALLTTGDEDGHSVRVWAVPS